MLPAIRHVAFFQCFDWRRALERNTFGRENNARRERLIHNRLLVVLASETSFKSRQSGQGAPWAPRFYGGLAVFQFSRNGFSFFWCGDIVLFQLKVGHNDAQSDMWFPLFSRGPGSLIPMGTRTKRVPVNVTVCSAGRIVRGRIVGLSVRIVGCRRAEQEKSGVPSLCRVSREEQRMCNHLLFVTVVADGRVLIRCNMLPETGTGGGKRYNSGKTRQRWYTL